MTSQPRAVILAGGRGVRLRPFTASLPKPLVPVGDMPILELVLRQLAQHDFSRVTLTLGHLADLIRAFILHHKSLTEKLNIDFVEEETPTGTAGSLSAIPGLESPFLVMNGDVLTNLNYADLMSVHKDSGAALTIATHQQKVKIDLGVLETNSSGAVVDYHEKPENSYEVSMGIYAYDPKVVELIEPDTYLDFPDLVMRLINKGEKVQTYRNDAFWLDIGRPDDYAKAQEIMETNPEKFGIF